MDNLEIDYKKAAQQLRSGEALYGKDGALAPLLVHILLTENVQTISWIAVSWRV